MYTPKHTNLFTATAIGISSMIGSGWLFAAYYSAQYAGPASIFSWIIGAVIALCLALLLAEIVTLHQQRGLFARLLTITHNRDCGFIIAISNWLCMVIMIPSEAEATTQYISTIDPHWTPYIFHQHQLTMFGTLIVCVLMIIYGLINFWGLRSLAKANNVITTIKLLVPSITGIIIIATVFHAHNFTAYKDTVAPYGVSRIFTAVTNSGIFYAFFGFSMISVFTKEIKNPKRNIPIALVLSVFTCLIIYLILQVAFIGAINPMSVSNGWHTLNFTSPLAQLALLLNLNVLAVILYADSALSPSGTGVVYAGSAPRMLTGMAKDRQMPKFFDDVHPIYNFSRRSLIFSLLFSFIMVLFFNNWQKIMVVVTVFQLISCVAVPIAFTKLRQTEANQPRLFKMPFGKTCSFLLYLLLTYLLTQAGTKALFTSLILHIIFFIFFSVSYYGKNTQKIKKSLKSCWTIFLYLVFTWIFGYLQDQHLLQKPLVLVCFLVLAVVMYYVILGQKDYHQEAPGKTA